MPAPDSINHLQWKLSNSQERRQLLKETKGSNKSNQPKNNGLSPNATAEEKVEALQDLMGQESSKQRQQEILEILESIDNRADMKYILTESGGAGDVLRHLGGHADRLIMHLNSMGPEGQKMIIDMAIYYYGKGVFIIGTLFHPVAMFISRYIDNNVISQATLEVVYRCQSGR
jgi:hypothetical protein